MNELSARLAARIAREGPISFADFMAAALYDPEHGYYGSGRAAIGRGGDFMTNVSVGPLFGRLLMRQFAEMWERLGRPPAFTIVEQGANAGDFAHDVLEGARQLERPFFEAVRYTVVEPLPKQQAVQRERLAGFAAKVEWVDWLSDLPPFSGVLFSNELIDSFPVQVVRFSDGGWAERRVAWDGDRFVWTEAPITGEVVRLLPKRMPEGYTTEVNLRAGLWLSEAASKLQAGWILAIDYGYPRADYYRPERSEGTLSAYANHRRVKDPLSAPGEIDLTAHVDFTTLAEAARTAGLEVVGFVDQHHFMAGVSRLHFTDVSEMTPAREKELRAFKTLMHPNMMGASFKVLCCARTAGPELSGFGFGNAIRELEQR